MVGMIKCGHLPNGNIGIDLLKGKSCLPLIIGQGPASPVFNAAVNRIVWFDPLSADAGLLQNIIGKLYSGLTNDDCEVTTAKSICDTGGQKEVIKRLQTVSQVMHRKVQHTPEGSARLLQINLIVSVHHRASSPRPKSA